jgi:hypothetical protein
VKIVIPGPLIAVDDYFTSPYNTPLVVAPPNAGFLANDVQTLPQCPIDMKSITVPLPSGDGAVSGLNPATGEFTFTPARGFRGNTSFTYSESLPAGPAWPFDARAASRPCLSARPPACPPAPAPQHACAASPPSRPPAFPPALRPLPQ